MSNKQGKRKPTKRQGAKAEAHKAVPTPAKNSGSRKGTPRGAQEEPAPQGPRKRAGVIVAIILIVVLGAGGFALWRLNEDRLSQENKNESVPVDVNRVDSERLERTLSNMTLEQKVAQLFVVRPEDLTDMGTVTEAGETTRRAIDNYPVGGMCYFDDNIVDPEQTSEMLRNSSNYSKDACGLPLFQCVDEEGGTVTRVASNDAFDVKDVGNMADIGESGKTNEAFDSARYVGGYLKKLGFNVDFAPVADIVTSSQSPLAKRSFGDTPDLVSSMVKAQVEGYTRAGMLCAAKHFPGIGEATDDSHDDEIYSSKTLEEMQSWELVPFEGAMEAGVPMIMVGHLTCTGLDSEEQQGDGDADERQLPATYDPDVIDGILRQRMGYKGIIVTDSLEMGAVAETCSESEQGVLAVKAGADLVLLPKDFKKAYDGLLQAVRSGDVSEERIDESVRRIIAEKLRMIG